jgi:hypothetical protein
VAAGCWLLTKVAYIFQPAISTHRNSGKSLCKMPVVIQFYLKSECISKFYKNSPVSNFMKICSACLELFYAYGQLVEEIFTGAPQGCVLV